MKLSVLREIMSKTTPGSELATQTQQDAFLRQMGLEPGDIYQELEMDSPYVDTHKDISYASTPVNLHSHDFYELLYCCNSCGVEYLVGAERYRLRRGDVILLPPGMSHRPLLPENMPEPYTRIVLWISREFMDRMAEAFPQIVSRTQSRSALLRTAGTPWESLETFFSEGVAIAQRQSAEAPMLLAGNTMLLLGRLRQALLEHGAGQIKAEKPQLLDRVMAYIEDHLSQKISLSEVARGFYVSESTITQTFRKKLGVSFYRCVTQRRLIAAKPLIQNGLALEQVAEQVGFSDYSSFYRAFRQEYGISPRQFRKL